MKIEKSRVGGLGQGECERRIEFIVKMQKNIRAWESGQGWGGGLVLGDGKLL